jgi:hypothetical protein
MPANLVNLDTPTLRQDFAITRDELAAAGQLVHTSSVSERNSEAVVPGRGEAPGQPGAEDA